MIDLPNLEHREVAFTVLRRTDESGDRVPGTQIEAANLTRRDVNVVGPSEIRAVRRAQEAETVLEDFEDTLAEDVLAIRATSTSSDAGRVLSSARFIPVFVCSSSSAGMISKASSSGNSSRGALFRREVRFLPLLSRCCLDPSFDRARAELPKYPLTNIYQS